MFSCKYCEIVKNTYFEEQLQTTASETPRVLRTHAHLSDHLFVCPSAHSFSQNLLIVFFWFLHDFKGV